MICIHCKAQIDLIFVHSYQTIKKILFLIEMIQQSFSSTNCADFRFKQESISQNSICYPPKYVQLFVSKVRRIF